MLNCSVLDPLKEQKLCCGVTAGSLVDLCFTHYQLSDQWCYI